MLRSGANATTFTFTLNHNASNSFRTGLVITSDSTHPGIWIISFGVGVNPTPHFYNIYKDSSSPTMSEATISGDTLTLKFASDVYGGVRIIWLG